MFKHVLLVVNPTAESHTDHRWITELIDRLNERTSCLVSVCYTSRETTAESLIELLEPPLDLVIAAGGDGTLRFALEALARRKSEIPLAIMPTGTGNVLARNLGIVSENFFADPMDRAIDCLLDGVVHPMDLGVANGHIFSGIGGVGPLAEAFAEPERKDKTRLQMFAYAATLIEKISEPPSVFRVYTKESVLEVEASSIFIGNVPDFGFHHSPELSYLADGMLCLAIVAPRNFGDYINLGYRFISGDHEETAPVYMRSFQELVLEVADTSVPRSSFQELVNALFNGGTNAVEETDRSRSLRVMLDGEMTGTTPVHVRVIPHAVNVVVPRGSSLLEAKPWLDNEPRSSVAELAD
ncbi:MAG: diacylglycerol kinase family protein [Candidatus Obscuribacterales bacterium]